jgi:hypothetical protein
VLVAGEIAFAVLTAFAARLVVRAVVPVSESDHVRIGARPAPWSKPGKQVVAVTLDITRDLMDEDESGYVWTFLREARDQRLIEPGAIVVAGDEDAPAVAEVVEIIDKLAGPVVHLRVLPGAIEDQGALVRRAIAAV